MNKRIYAFVPMLMLLAWAVAIVSEKVYDRRDANVLSLGPLEPAANQSRDAFGNSDSGPPREEAALVADGAPEWTDITCPDDHGVNGVDCSTSTGEPGITFHSADYTPWMDTTDGDLSAYADTGFSMTVIATWITSEPGYQICSFADPKQEALFIHGKHGFPPSYGYTVHTHEYLSEDSLQDLFIASLDSGGVMCVDVDPHVFHGNNTSACGAQE